jgi:hypothetical protein
MGVRKSSNTSAHQSTVEKNAWGSVQIIVDTNAQVAAQRAWQKASSLLEKDKGVLLHH